MSTQRHELAGPRFWAKVDKSGECWLWVGSVSVYGYGQFSAGRGVNKRAHRVAYEHEFGAIPNGLVLDHLCRVRHCVNPAHLEAVTSKENILRGVGATAMNAAKKLCKEGHEFDSTGSKGERRCTKCDNAKTSEWSKSQRMAIVCGALTRDEGKCKMRITAGNKCRNHSVTNPLPATVLYEPTA